jgi:hypothetical protein
MCLECVCLGTLGVQVAESLSNQLDDLVRGCNIQGCAWTICYLRMHSCKITYLTSKYDVWMVYRLPLWHEMKLGSIPPPYYTLLTSLQLQKNEKQMLFLAFAP